MISCMNSKKLKFFDKYKMKYLKMYFLNLEIKDGIHRGF